MMASSARQAGAGHFVHANVTDPPHNSDVTHAIRKGQRSKNYERARIVSLCDAYFREPLTMIGSVNLLAALKAVEFMIIRAAVSTSIGTMGHAQWTFFPSWKLLRTVNFAVSGVETLGIISRKLVTKCSV